MKNLRQSLRLSLGLASLAVSVLCILHSCAILPDPSTVLLQGRKEFCEAVAIYCASGAVRGDRAMIESTTRSIVERNPNIRSFAVVRADGTRLVEAGAPLAPTETSPESRPGPDRAEIPIFLEGKRWGTVLIRFKSAGQAHLPGVLADPTIRFIVFLAAGIFTSNLVYLTIVFGRERTRAGGIPDRIRATLDTLVEGVLLMDTDRRIALVNESFARMVGRTAADLEGRTAEELAWVASKAGEASGELPWDDAIEGGKPELGRIIGLRTTSNGSRTLSANSTPIVADDGTCRGVLTTFDDMTSVERRNVQLRKLLERLKRSRAEIFLQNQKLQDLATRDPLTSCLNRRALFERFQPMWTLAARHGQPLSCLLLDIDHFKSVNDRYGHGVGDEALQAVSGVLRAIARPGDLVCRYGGEEFCIVLDQTGAADAVAAADRCREAIAATRFSGISVTASFGVASLTMSPRDPHDMINRADQALYAAKRTGRNRVVRYDQLPEELLVPEPKAAPDRAALSVHPDIPIPYHAVTSLIAALAHRDPSTAEHSRRVADLCVQTARGLISERDCYILEIAALLHDVGKLGIPDAILKKPGALTREEWNVMKAHDVMGVEILTAAFSSDDLRALIRTYHAWYAGNERSPELPHGEAIPLGARILALADAYDAMVSDRVYRKAMSRDGAFEELRRCAGRQFDPALVERFIGTILARDERRQDAVSTLSKGSALKIGLLIETLVDALDAKDRPALKAKAAQLRALASEFEARELAELCGRIEIAVTTARDWLEIMELTSDLLDLCRATQRSYLTTYAQDEFAPDAEAIPQSPQLACLVPVGE